MVDLDFPPYKENEQWWFVWYGGHGVEDFRKYGPYTSEAKAVERRTEVMAFIKGPVCYHC